MLNKLSNQLKDFGLSENEIKVYITVLQLSSESASKIASYAKLNRSTTYVQLTALISYGLVSTFKKKKKTYFIAESPANLSRLIDTKIEDLKKKKQNISNLIPDLINLYENYDERPQVQTFRGKEGLKTMRNRVIESKVPELHAAFCFDDLYEIFSETELMDFSNKRAEAGMHSKVFYNKKGKDAVLVSPQELKRVDRKKYPFSSDIYIYGDTVSIASTSGNIMGVTIRNKYIAESLRTLYKLAWDNVE